MVHLSSAAVPGAAFVPGGGAVMRRASGVSGQARAAGMVLTPETLHPDLWRGHQFGRHAENGLPSGFAALDAQLPGGGWPRRALTELLLPHPGVGEIRLLSHCLRATQHSGRPVMLFDPPAALSGWALAQLGLDVEQLLIVVTRVEPLRVDGHERSRRLGETLPHDRHASTDRRVGSGLRQHDGQRFVPEQPHSDSRLWALEQALKSGHVGAVLAWLPPRLRSECLRRLQLAAHGHDGVAFVLREMAAAQQPSAAPLRLALHPAGADVLALRMLKRRGPPLEAPLQLELPPVLSRSARQRARAGVASIPVLHAATFVNLV
jgi:protein ImuA